VVDSSGNDNTGTISRRHWTTSGRYGNALLFNGTTNVVSVSNAPRSDSPRG